MRVAVTGGAGFIGSHLCRRLLNDQHEVICIDNLLTGSRNNLKEFESNSRFSFVKHDVIQPFPQTLPSIDAIFHMASPASPNHHSKLSYHSLPMETMLVNTTGTLQALMFAEKNQAKFLFASTSEVYGDPLQHPQTETYLGNSSTTGPRSVYDEAKRFGETLTAYYWRNKNTDARIARIFNTFGPSMLVEDKRMIVSFITQAIKNKPITIFGDGSQTRSLCYIDDLVEGLIRLMFYPTTKAQIVNLGNPEEHTVLEYAQMIKKLTNSKSEIKSVEQLPIDDPKKRKADITKAKKILDWEPKTSLEEGLQKTISYFQSL